MSFSSPSVNSSSAKISTSWDPRLQGDVKVGREVIKLEGDNSHTRHS